MKRIALLFLPLLLLTGCGDDNSFLGIVTRGSGELVTEERTPGTFTGISAGNSIDVVVKQGPEISVSILADDNIIDDVTTNVSRGVLEIKLGSGSYSNYTLDVDITLPELDFIELKNSASLSAAGFVGVNDLEIALGNSSDLDIEDFQGMRTLELRTGNSSEADISGSADVLDLTANNSSDIDAFDLFVRECRVDAGNSSDLSVTVSERLTGEIGNSAKLRYRGDPEQVDVRVGNSADLIKE